MLSTVFGGLSGPAIKPVALRAVYQVAGAVDVPIVGCGGISRGEDAIEFIMAGATAVQVGTATFANPNAPLDVLDGIERFLADAGVSDVRELVGAARVAQVTAALPPTIMRRCFRSRGVAQSG